jgi:mannose-6-phosphate isomerase-like protein (cupin superfamily)
VNESDTTKDRRDIAALASAVHRLLEDAGELAAAFLHDWRSRARWRVTAPRALPVLRWLNPACRAGSTGAAEVLAALEAASPRLAWRQTYGPEDFGADFLERYGWTELMGKRGPIMSDRIAVGFLLLGPHLIYPPHSHDAEEVYLPLSGVAAWRRGAEPWRDVPPGALIHHPSRLPHAVRTGAEPLLALYAWRGGDLAQKSRIE